MNAIYLDICIFNEKLIFRKFAKDTLFFFYFIFTVGLIVDMQAVNYFDFVTQDGHGLKTYFSYILCKIF